MKGELDHTKHPWHTYIRWAIFYVAVLAIGISGFVLAANRIRTYKIPSGSLELSIPYKKYVVGESISFTLKNNYNSTVYVEDECPKEPLIVYLRTGTDWTRVHDTASSTSCSDKERRISIAPYSQRTSTFDAWPHLFEKPGIYRVVAHVDYFDTAPYQDFEVIAKPVKVAATPMVLLPSSLSKSTLTIVQSPASTPVGNTITAPATPVTPPPTTPAPTLTSQTVTISNGSSISVQYSATTINVISIKPATGCSYEGGRSGANVQVQFTCAGRDTTIILSVVNGVLTWHTEN